MDATHRLQQAAAIAAGGAGVTGGSAQVQGTRRHPAMRFTRSTGVFPASVGRRGIAREGVLMGELDPERSQKQCQAQARPEDRLAPWEESVNSHEVSPARGWKQRRLTRSTWSDNSRPAGRLNSPKPAPVILPA